MEDKDKTLWQIGFRPEASVMDVRNCCLLLGDSIGRDVFAKTTKADTIVNLALTEEDVPKVARVLHNTLNIVEVFAKEDEDGIWQPCKAAELVRYESVDLAIKRTASVAEAAMLFNAVNDEMADDPTITVDFGENGTIHVFAKSDCAQWWHSVLRAAETSEIVDEATDENGDWINLATWQL